MKRHFYALPFCICCILQAVFVSCDDNGDDKAADQKIIIKVESMEDIRGTWQGEDIGNHYVMNTYIFEGDRWTFRGENRRSGMTWEQYGTYSLYERFVIFYYDEVFGLSDEPVSLGWASDVRKKLVIGRNEYMRVK